MNKLLKTAFIKTLPVMAGYMVLGFGFGIVAAENGYGVLWAAAMSIFIYAGSMQYVTVSLLSGGASLISSFLTTLMVNARHLFYGVSMLKAYKNVGKKKPYLIFSLTDETYSLVCDHKAPDNQDFHKYCLFVSLLNHSYWVLGTLLGSLAGEFIGIDFSGVEFSMTALFITIFVEQWISAKNHFPALIGIFSSVVSLLIFGKENFLIPSMHLITVFLIIFRPILSKKEDKPDEQS